MKSYTTGAKNIEWPDQLSMKRQGNCKSAYTSEDGSHTLHSLRQISSKEEKESRLIHHFYLLRPNYQLEYSITKRKRK